MTLLLKRLFFIFSLAALFNFTPLASRAETIDDVHFGGEGELYFPLPVENAAFDGYRLRIRSVEGTAQSNLSEWLPGLAGKLTYGAEDASGDLTFNLREAFVYDTDAALPGLTVRAGKFYLPIGQLNQERRSAWPFITAPRAITLFFTDNGIVDTGADLNYQVGRFQVRAGASNGYRYDSSITNAGTRPETPTHFAQAELAFPTTTHTITVAGDYLGRVDDQGEVLRISGLDVRYEPNQDEPKAWRGQAEFYHRYQNPRQGLAIVEDLGGYGYIEKGLSEKLAAGLRLDAYKIPSLTDSSGQNRYNLTWAVAPALTYQGSQHSRLQGDYTYLKETRDGNSTRVEQTFELRLVVEFGEIPRSRTPARPL